MSNLDLSALNDIAKIKPTEPDKSILERLRFDDALDIPHQLSDVDVWINYCNDDLYELDRAVRAFIKKSRWTRETKGSMKTSVPLTFLAIFGRKPTAKDSYTCMIMHRLMRYYCTSYTGTSKISGQRFNHVYHFSKYACVSKRALSLRLRLEESNGANSSFREYSPGQDKRAEPRRGVTQHGPLADGRGRTA